MDHNSQFSDVVDAVRGSVFQITNTLTVPEIAFTGDTMADFILDPDNADVLKAKILVVEVLLLIVYMVNLLSIVIVTIQPE